MIVRGLATIGSRLLARIPPRLAHWTAARVADLVFAGWTRREVIVANMEQVVAYTGDPRSPQQLARLSLRHYAFYLADFLRLACIDPVAVGRAVPGGAWEQIEEYLRSGRGVLIAGVHMGNWDFAGFAIRQHGFPFLVIADRLRPPRLDTFVQRRRRELGMTPVPAEQAARPTLRALRNGGLVGMLIDRPVPGTGVPVEFFGRTCYLPAGAAALSLRTGAKVVPATLVRHQDGAYEIVLDLSIEYESTGNFDADVLTLSQRIMSAHERWIGQWPEQWYMFRRMWPVVEPAVEPSWVTAETRA